MYCLLTNQEGHIKKEYKDTAMSVALHARAMHFFDTYSQRIRDGESDLIRNMDDLYHANIIHYLGSILPPFGHLQATTPFAYRVKLNNNNSCGNYFMLVYLVQFIKKKVVREKYRKWIETNSKPDSFQISCFQKGFLVAGAGDTFARALELVESGGVAHAIQLTKNTNWKRRQALAIFRTSTMAMVDSLKSLKVIHSFVGKIVLPTERRPHCTFVHIMFVGRLVREITSFV